MLNNKRLRDAMNVILSEVKDLTVGMRVYYNRLKINEAKMIEGSLKILPPMRGPSLRSG
jgi:hypothetical protein